MLLVPLFLFPLLWLLRISFFPGKSFSYELGFTLEHYVHILTDSFYLGIIAYTIELATIVTPIVLLLSYPLAYLITLSGIKRKGILFLIVITPITICPVILAFGMWNLLRDSGLVNIILLKLNLIKEPLRLLFTTTSVVFGLIYIILPYAVLILVSSFNRVRKDYIDMARVLGANRLKVFLHVILPLTRSGALAAASVAFMWCMASYVEPTLLGHGGLKTIAMEVESKIIGAHNWPMGTAISVVLLLFSILFVLIYHRFMEK